MKNKSSKQKSRRTFLQSTGMVVAGLSVFKPSVLAIGRSSKTTGENLASSLLPEALMQDNVRLPEGVKAVWDIAKAFHETTPTRERICINGLWQWQPGIRESEQVPVENWGYFKVPGYWPGLNNYIQWDSQKVYPHPAWKDEVFGKIDTAWYQREIAIPDNWQKRRISLYVEYLNSNAIVFVDGKKAGEILFPAGELDLTEICPPGSKHIITIKVVALPLQDVVALFNDSNAPRQGKGFVSRRGICGDVYLSGIPMKTRIKDVKVVTSFRKEEITFHVGLENLSPRTKYTLQYIINDKGYKAAEFKSNVFTADELKDGVISFTKNWKPSKIWDVHTPENMFDLSVSLLENDKTLLDTALPSRFGFREFWIDGRDFYLNGKRIYLSAVPLDNAQIGAVLANYEGAKESMRRLQSFGINFVYTHNYGCEPGTHVSFTEVLRAADDTGMLISLSQPHFGQYNWTDPDADQNNGYARHAKFYCEVANNHPSVVFYSTSHNATGYSDDMNPDKIDGLGRPEASWSSNNVKRALRAEAIITALDPSRIVYHHSSGDLSSMHTSNFYPNWVPIQEMCDWFEHWATKGVKPVFLCEYGAPFVWDWATYRGWYKGKREFGSARVPWGFCIAEWNAQFFGSKAYKISESEKINLRWEAKKFQEGVGWARWDYPITYGSTKLTECEPVYAMHIRDQWRAFRTWGMSANSPWSFSPYWKLNENIKSSRKDLVVDWENLQKPGLSPDFIQDRAGRMDLDVGYNKADWINTLAADALIQNNLPLLAYIGGKTSAFTSKDHNFLPGTKFEKQLIVINNSREKITCECNWYLNLPEAVKGNKTITIDPGNQERIPLSFNLPSGLAPGKYEIISSVKFSNGEIQKDSFIIHVLKPAEALTNYTSQTALFDPQGETRKMLDSLGIKYQLIDAGTDLSGFEVLIIGKGSLTVDGKAPDVTGVRNGLKVIVFEQASEVLEKRFGFRVQEYGLRQVFKRVPDHPLLAGLDEDNLSYWKGDATILPERLKLETKNNVFSGVGTVKWCDITVTRLWRCGNRGNVASVLIEKPACGDFMPVVDGGYSLQYSPLMEYREGKGMVIFCQMDVTGRTEPDPAADLLMNNILSYARTWTPGTKKQAVYSGDPAGKAHLEKAGFKIMPVQKKKLSPEQVLIIGPGSSNTTLPEGKALAKWMKKGGKILAIGLNQEDVSNLLPVPVKMRTEEHIASYFDSPGIRSVFAGIGSADVHNRAPINIPLVSEGARTIGNGVLASTENTDMVFCQLVPWQLDYSKEKHNVKQTYRRSSFLMSRLMSNMDAMSSTPLLGRFSAPVDPGKAEKRWLDGLYLDEPEEWDDPYRFFRW